MDIRRILAYGLKPWFIVAGLFITLFMVGVYSLPSLLKLKLPQLIEARTGRKASVAAIDLTWFPTRLTVQGLQMQEKNGSPFISFDTFTVQLNTLQSLTNKALVIDKATLVKPSVRLSQEQDGVYNFQDLLSQDNARDVQQAPLPLAISQLNIVDGTVFWQAIHAGQLLKENITPINLQIENFSIASGQPFDMQLSLALASGGHLDWKGVASVRPMTSEGHIKLDGVTLQRIHELALPALDVQGKLSFDSDYQLSYANAQLKVAAKQAKLDVQDFHYGQSGQQLSLSAIGIETALNVKQDDKGWQFEGQQAKLSSHGFQLAYQQTVLVKIPAISMEAAYLVNSAGKDVSVTLNNGQLVSHDLQLLAAGLATPLVKIPGIAIQGADLNLSKRSLTIASILAKDAELKAWLTPEGTFNYQNLLNASAPVQVQARGAVAPEKTWAVNVGTLAVNNLNAAFEDRTFKKPTTLNLNAVSLKLSDFNNQPASKLPFEASIGVNKSGLIKLNGESVLQPLAAQMKIDVQNLELEKFQTYYDKFIHVDVLDGGLNVNGDLNFGNSADGKLDIKFKGSAGIADLLTRDQKVNKDLLKWENLALQELAVDTSANRYSAAVLTIDRPFARVTIRKDKTVNFFNLMVSGSSSASTDTKAAANVANNPKPYFKLGRILVINGSSDFTDLSLILPFAAQIKSLDGGASGVSSEKNATVKLALSGNAYELAPVNIKGEISPSIGNYDIQVSFNGLPMPLVSPYMVQFAGYKVEKGKMNLELNYRVADRKLSATNKLLVDQFELGDKVDNPNAVTIPVKLAVVLLKDANGKIKFDVPVSGSLDDPRFNLGAVIGDAFINALSKIAAAPFNAIASLFDSKEKNLSTIAFTPGNAKLELSEISKLDKIAKALQTRPELNLDVKGTAFQDQDWPAIRDDALYDQLKKRRAGELNKNSAKKIRPEYVELSKDDYNRLLADMFMEKFPLLADKSFFGTPMLKNVKAGDFYEVAKQKLYEIIEPEEERLKGLAVWRAQSIAKYMVQKGGIGQERIYILDTVIDPPKTTKEISSVLSLSVN